MVFVCAYLCTCSLLPCTYRPMQFEYYRILSNTMEYCTIVMFQSNASRYTFITTKRPSTLPPSPRPMHARARRHDHPPPCKSSSSFAACRTTSSCHNTSAVCLYESQLNGSPRSMLQSPSRPAGYKVPKAIPLSIPSSAPRSR